MQIVERIKEVFSLDTRSMALFRILLGSIALYDLAVRSMYLRYFYTDHGVMPRDAVLETFWKKYYFSLHMMSGEPLMISLLFIIAAIAALCYLIGYKTKIANVILWVLLMSIMARNQLVCNSGDVVFRLMLFFSIFLPVHARWSVDKLLNLKEPKIPKLFLSAASLFLILQVAIIYPASVVAKTGLSWQNGTSVFLALNIDQHATPIGQWLLNFPSLLKILGFFTLYIEKFAWLLLFVPIKAQWFRLLAVALFASMHAGFLFGLYLGLFGVICITAWLALLPPLFWDKLLPKFPGYKTLQNIATKIQIKASTTVQKLITREYLNRRIVHFFPGTIPNIIVAFFGSFIMLWNFASMDLIAFPSQAVPIVRYPRLEQGWAMFSPDPYRDDGWYVTRGLMADGSYYDFFQQRPADFAKPKNVANAFGNQRRRRYMRNLWQKRNKPHRGYYTKCHCRDWNREHKGTPKEVQLIELFYVREMTQINGTQPVIDTLNLWNQACHKKYKALTQERANERKAKRTHQKKRKAEELEQVDGGTEDKTFQD